MEFMDWLLWFAIIPAGSLLVFGGLVFWWAGSVTLTRRRRWVVTLVLSGAFIILEMALIAKFAWVLPD